jgi:hypothetical protein
VPKVEELTALFNSLIAVHSDTLMHRLTSTIYLLGNMPEITRADHLQLDAKVGPNGENAINVLDISNDRDVFKRLKIDAFKMLCYRAPTQTDSLIQHVLQRDINGLNVGLGRL